MQLVTVTEAKAKFADLIRAVERGEEIVLTRHGKRIARLKSETEGEEEFRHPSGKTEVEVQEALEELAKIRSRQPKINTEEIIEMRNYGRR